MPTKIIVALLCLLVGSLAQQWEQSVVIEESEHPIVFQRMYVDQYTATRHFIYGLQFTRYRVDLVYRRLFANGTLTPAVLLMEGFRHYRTSDITGADDGKRIYISTCMKRPDADYYDVYFMESADGGETFQRPVPVPRSSPADAVNRYAPNIKFNEDKERLWIFYFSKDEKDVVSISYVSRPKGSSIFLPEKTAATGVLPKNQLRFELTNDNDGKQILYAAYLHAERDFFWPRIYFSSNNGLTWNHTDGYEHYVGLLDDDAQLDIAAHDEVPKFYYTANTYRGSSGYETQYSKYYPTSQAHWESIGVNLNLNRLVMCKANSAFYVVGYSTVSNPGLTTYQTGHLVVMKYKELEDWKELTPPFVNTQDQSPIKFSYVTYPDISCVTQMKTKMVASSVGITNAGKNLLVSAQAVLDPYVSEPVFAD